MTLAFSTFGRATRSIWENLYLNAVSASVVDFFGVARLYSLIQNNLNTADSWNKDIHISVYFAETVDETSVSICETKYTRCLKLYRFYVSESDAKKWMLEEVSGIEEHTELGDNILPASLEITLDAQMAHPKQIEDFAKRFKQRTLSQQTMGLSG